MESNPTPTAAPTASLVIIGNEVLSGRTKDANLAYLGAQLAEMGIRMMEVRIVPDIEANIVEAVNALRSRYSYVFTTGGIGPTHDDITADAVAAAFGVALPEHPDAIAILEKRYGPGEFNTARRRMARVPEGGTLIANPVTDAPGFRIGNVFVLAGVPKIMTAMLEDVVPQLPTGVVVQARTIRVSGVGEGDIAEILTAAARAEREISFGSYPFGHGTVGEVGTNLVVRGRDGAKVEAAVDGLMAALAEAGVNALRA